MPFLKPFIKNPLWTHSRIVLTATFFSSRCMSIVYTTFLKPFAAAEKNTITNQIFKPLTPADKICLCYFKFWTVAAKHFFFKKSCHFGDFFVLLMFLFTFLVSIVHLCLSIGPDITYCARDPKCKREGDLRNNGDTGHKKKNCWIAKKPTYIIQVLLNTCFQLSSCLKKVKFYTFLWTNFNFLAV